MRLGQFILANIEPILAEWEGFARTFTAGAVMDPLALRDHAEHILRAAARDMASAQTAGEQSEKSKGHGEEGANSRRLDGASEEHAAARVASGFDILAVVAEYRALRASVVRLWRQSNPTPDLHDLDDLTRFHESIDQSLANAVRGFTEQVGRSRQLFLAILGHDLRNPLNAIALGGQALGRSVGAGQLPADDVRELADGISSSADAMGKMIADLLDFTSAGLGAAMPLTPRDGVDLRALCCEVVHEIRAANPGRVLHLITAEGANDLTGRFDPQRLRQLLSNLLGNAIQHGDADRPVTLRVSASAGGGAGGDARGVEIAVHNEGPPIPKESFTTIFDPLVRLASPALRHRRRPGSIGLGLYIAREVALAHGGTIDVTSSAEQGTTFTVRLPRKR